jgi:hypothetical protein
MTHRSVLYTFRLLSYEVIQKFDWILMVPCTEYMKKILVKVNYVEYSL